MMAGGNILAIGGAGKPAPLEDQAAVMAPANAPGTATEENLQKGREGGGSMMWWLVLVGFYFVFDWLMNRDKVFDAVQPRNIRANLWNLAIIGTACLIFVNGGNVLFTKLTAMKIPIVSRVAGAILPLFHL
jgi:hypothetical protein